MVRACVCKGHSGLPYDMDAAHGIQPPFHMSLTMSSEQNTMATPDKASDEFKNATDILREEISSMELTNFNSIYGIPSYDDLNCCFSSDDDFLE